MADATDTQHWLDLIDETKRRMHALQRQRAQLGFATPPHISNEIEQCEKDIELYRAQLHVGMQPSEKAQNEVPGDVQALLIEYRLKQQDEKITDALTGIVRTIEKIQTSVYRLEAQFETDQKVRKERQEENDARFTGIEDQNRTQIDIVSRLSERVGATLWNVSLLIAVALIMVSIIVWMTR